MSKSCSELSNQISENVALNISQNRNIEIKKYIIWKKTWNSLNLMHETLDEFSVILRFFCRFMQRRKKAQKREDPPPQEF